MLTIEFLGRSEPALESMALTAFQLENDHKESPLQ